MLTLLRVASYLTVYNVMLVLGITFYCMSFLVYLFGALRASRKLHKTLVGSVLSATLRWLDKTPTSRIITRCTQDIQCSECSLSTRPTTDAVRAKHTLQSTDSSRTRSAG